MLCTATATYSFGKYYNPFKIAFARIVKQGWALPNNFLLLGGALLSALQVLQQRHKHLCQAVTAIECDEHIAQLAKTYNNNKLLATCNITVADALDFIKKDNGTYDCIGIDLFIGMAIPVQFTTLTFLQLCKQRLAAGGVVICNAYFSDQHDLKKYLSCFVQVFPDYELIKHDVNCILIARHNTA
jgi:spermidine synthase